MYDILADQSMENEKNIASERSKCDLYENPKSAGKPSYWKNSGTEPLKETTIGYLLDYAASAYEDRICVNVYNGEKITFAEANKRAEAFAAGLVALGLEKGDHIGLWGSNTIKWYISLLGGIKAAFVVVNLNPLYEAPELLKCLQKGDIKAIIMDEYLSNHNYYEVFRKVVPDIVNYENGTEIKCQALPMLKIVITMSSKLYNGTFRWDDLICDDEEQLNKIDSLKKRAHHDDICNIQFTSGTTGTPKGVQLSHYNVVNNSYFFGKRLGYDKKHHSICLQVPLFHTFGTVLGILAGLHHGCTLVMPSAKFSPTMSIRAIISEKCTFIYGTPTMFIDLMTVLNEMSAKNPDIYSKFHGSEAFIAGACGYGMTEASPLTFTSLSTDSDYQIMSTVGYVSDHTEVKVVDSEGNIVPMGTPGEICYRGYMITRGYYKDEKFTRNLISPDGWLKSGDRFVLLENGYGQIVGRIKDIIIRGGENIDPAEIENVLVKHPDILNCQVYGVYDKRLGETVAVSVIKIITSHLSEDDVKNYCKGHFADYKIPQYVKFMDNFPRTVSGKIQKFQLREMLEKELNLRESRHE